MIASRKDAAKLLGITDRQLGNWVHEEWFPPNGKTKAGWDIELIRQCQEAAGKKGSELSDEAKRISLEEKKEKLGRIKIQRAREQLRLDRERGKVIPRPGVELFASTILTELADWCDQLPDLIANTVPAKLRKQLKNRIRDELDKRRTNMREQLEREAKHLDEQQEEA
ncbi:hypothetical protein SH661x_000414 [Planctomicrobium sp. SH661]|uniref:hypothetical protein n=1 Tax=Planctomicrobium sp. SH661 TaxID=3448124 RepID=UPI003F5C3821